IIVEADPRPRRRPGETLHYGAISIFEQLGVREVFERATDWRYGSIQVDWGGHRPGPAFLTSHLGGEHRGFQIYRDKLDALLIDRAESMGADVRRPCRALHPIIRARKVEGVQTDLGPLEAVAVIDASGNGNWLRKRCALRQEVASPRLIARYGYCRVDD